VSQVGEDVYKEKALLALDCLPNDFVQSCAQCAAYFAGVQQQVSALRLASHSFYCVDDQHQMDSASWVMSQTADYESKSWCCEMHRDAALACFC